MPRICIWASLWCVCQALGSGGLSAQEVPRSETLLPKTTVGFVAVADVEELTRRWETTQLGQLMKDPVMQPFAKDLRRQFEDRLSVAREKLGVTLDDLEGVAGGEVALAAIRPAPGRAAVAVLVDVSGHVPQAVELLEKVSASLIRQGGKRQRLEVPESPDPVVHFQLPKPEDQPEAEPRNVFHVLSGNLLAAADDLDVVRGILARRAGGNGSLAEVPGFLAVMARCRQDSGPGEHQVRWFVEPLGYVEVVRTNTPEKHRRKGKSVLAILRNQGFGAIRGAGGLVDLASEGYELVHRTAVYAPRPYEKAMKMLVFPNGPDFTPQPWVPREIATYSTGYCDILNAFDNFDSIFDEVVGEGEQGIWQEVLDSLKNDPNGPQIDLRAELVVHLGPRVTMLTDYQLPITPTSERLLFAIETKDPQAVTDAIRKSMENDPSAKRREIEGRVIWEIVEEEAPPVPEVSIGDIPSLTPDEEEEEEEEEVRLLPHAAVTVAHGQLLIASHLDFLLKVLDVSEQRETLAHSPDYRLVESRIAELAIAQTCLRSFSRTDEEYRPTYELIRQGKMPLSETMLGRLLNAVLASGKKGEVRDQRIDGTKLPDYDVVRRYLGPAGLVASSEADGWFLKGFTLNKESP